MPLQRYGGHNGRRKEGLFTILGKKLDIYPASRKYCEEEGALMLGHGVLIRIIVHSNIRNVRLFSPILISKALRLDISNI